MVMDKEYKEFLEWKESKAKQVDKEQLYSKKLDELIELQKQNQHIQRRNQLMHNLQRHDDSIGAGSIVTGMVGVLLGGLFL